MADNNTGTMNNSNPNQTIKAEQAKAEMSGHNQQKAQSDKERGEPSAIGGGQNSSQSQTGEQGRARDEIGGQSSDASSKERESVTPR